MTTNMFGMFIRFACRTRSIGIPCSFICKIEIGTLIYYPVPPHLQQAYEGDENLRCGSRAAKKDDFPIAEMLSKSIISIPMSQVLTDDQISEVIEALNEFTC